MAKKKVAIPPELLEASRAIDSAVAFNPAGTRAVLFIPDSDSPAASRLDKRWKYAELLANRLNAMPEIQALSGEATRYLNHLVNWLASQSNLRAKAQRRMERADWIGEMQRQSDERRSGATVKLANDKVHALKDDVRQFWLEYRAGRYRNRGLRGNGDFSRECVKRWPVLKQSTIERKWIPQWEKEVRAHPAS